MDDSICKARQTCRICGSPKLSTVIDLGDQYIATIFVKGEVPDYIMQPYPLELVRCSADSCCGLVQLKHTISPNILYKDYGYRSDINEIMRTNLRGITAKIEEMVPLKKGDIVLDIGCNDGTMLSYYQTEGLDRLGIDPATNVVEVAKRKGLDTVNTFFSYEAFSNARPGKRARVITSIAMFYDLEDPQQFVEDISKTLDDDGLWVNEIFYLPYTLEKTSFDTIVHEHLEYFTLRQIEWMLVRAGLQVQKIEFNDINGGSFRLFIRKKAYGPVSDEDKSILDNVRQNEIAMGLDTDVPYRAFRESSQKVRNDLHSLLLKFKAEGKKVYVYGASTKGNTTLQFCDIDNKLVGKAADRDPKKWGRRTLGTNIPIVSEEEARADNPDYFLVLPWHFFEGFIKREEAFLKRGGKFILPLPEVKIVGINDL